LTFKITNLINKFTTKNNIVGVISLILTPKIYEKILSRSKLEETSCLKAPSQLAMFNLLMEETTAVTVYSFSHDYADTSYEITLSTL